MRIEYLYVGDLSRRDYQDYVEQSSDAAAAADLTSIADEESGAAGAERDARERARLLETLGADPAARTQPPAVRTRRPSSRMDSSVDICPGSCPESTATRNARSCFGLVVCFALL